MMEVILKVKNYKLGFGQSAARAIVLFADAEVERRIQGVRNSGQE